MSEIVPPCGCVELVEGNYISRCYCSNRDDGERAAAWCVEANHKAAADYDRCTIEFLRKETAEQAAEIERLRAALRDVMVGGNHLATVLGIGHLAAGSSHEAALDFYGPGPNYDVWCCWNAIMQARAALGKK